MGAVFACKAIVARGRIARSRPRLGFPVHAFAGTLRRSDPVGGVAAENPRPRTTGRLGGIALKKGRGQLLLHALEIPGKQVADVRYVALTFRKASA